MNEITISVEPGTPARLDSGRVAKLLGVNEHDIPTLCRARLLKPLGNPVPSAPKHFATCELVRLANDPEWLDKATRAITQYWKKKNAGRRNCNFDAPDKEPTTKHTKQTRI
jgi:hypothetical protein